MNPSDFGPGDLVDVTVNVESPGIRNAGIYLIDPRREGALMVDPGDALRIWDTNPFAMVHSSPHGGNNGVASFQFQWQAPSMPSVIHFDVFAVVGNGDNSDRGDASIFGRFQQAFDCTPFDVWPDRDRDGVGLDGPEPLQACGPLVGFSPMVGDCNDNDERLFPGNPELCNDRDEDCDGQIDEGITATCGIGNCRRYATSCDPGALCIEGDPQAEACNGLDEDCNGVVDDGDLCAEGFYCHRFTCKTLEEALAEDPEFVPFTGSMEPDPMMDPMTEPNPPPPSMGGAPPTEPPPTTTAPLEPGPGPLTPPPSNNATASTGCVIAAVGSGESTAPGIPGWLFGLALWVAARRRTRFSGARPVLLCSGARGPTR